MAEVKIVNSEKSNVFKTVRGQQLTFLWLMHVGFLNIFMIFFSNGTT